MFRRRFLLLALLVLLLSAAAIAVWFALPKKTAVTVEVSGTPGLAVQGTCDVDGNSRDLTGTVPTQFVLEGYRVTYSLTSAEDSGEFRVRTVIRDQAYGSSSSGSPPRNGVRGWVKSAWWGARPDHWIESFHREEQRGWFSPPP
jgi:hypothetical protein